MNSISFKFTPALYNEAELQLIIVQAVTIRLVSPKMPNASAYSDLNNIVLAKVGAFYIEEYGWASLEAAVSEALAQMPSQIIKDTSAAQVLMEDLAQFLGHGRPGVKSSQMKVVKKEALTNENEQGLAVLGDLPGEGEKVPFPD